MAFENPEYDEQTMQIIANESPTFTALLTGLVADTDNEYPTNEAWLGTLIKDKTHTQIKLVVTQDPNKKIDED